MKSRALGQLSLSVWPFILLSGGELLGAFLIMRGAPAGRSPGQIGIQALAAITVGVVIAWVCIAASRRLVNRSRSAAWRSTAAAICIYVVIAIVSGLVMALMLVDFASNANASQITVLYTVTRPINALVAAVIVQQVRDGIRESRELQEVVNDRLELTRNTNDMIASAEQDLRHESRRLLASEVVAPLSVIVREGRSLSDEALADRLDDYIAHHLRPMAHVLHPVSVRLGLIPAIRGLDSGLSIDAAPTIARMDADGTLLDDLVRLQVYRWLRESLAVPGASRAALAVRGRELEVSIHPLTAAPLDAVQVAAGLRQGRPGVITAPLRGQSVEPEFAREAASARSRRPRYRLRELLTVPLPQRLILVTLLSIGAAPFQFVLYRWSLSLGTVLSVLMLAACAISMAYLLEFLPEPRPTIAGALRVVAEWLAIAAAAALGLVVPALIFGALPVGLDEAGLAIFRMSYRFALPGLAVVIGHGLLVTAQRQLARANESLEDEYQHRADLLAESQQVDRDVAEALHRTVQGRLAAAVVMLRLGQRDEAWHQVVNMAEEHIPDLLGRLGGPVPGGALVVDAPIGLSVVQVGDIAFRGAMLADVRSALGEIAANARGHGHASSLTISVDCLDEHCRIICEDDGIGLSASMVPGLGSRLLDETVARYGGRWSIESSDFGCRVVLDLPLPATERGLASSVS